MKIKKVFLSLIMALVLVNFIAMNWSMVYGTGGIPAAAAQQGGTGAGGSTTPGGIPAAAAQQGSTGAGGSTTTTSGGNLLDGVLTGMKGITNGTSDIAKAQEVINTVIGLIQVAGTGIAIIVITIQGIKYMTASAGERADIKKQAIPIVIGCLILFTAVNIMAVVADFGDTLNSIT